MGWPLLISQSLNASISQFGFAGGSEYRNLRQVRDLENSTGVDLAIIAHTSPFRLFTNEHPLRGKDSLHFNSDFVVADTFENKSYYKNDPHIKAARLYFEYLMDEKHSLDVHRLICEKIEQIGNSLKFPVWHTSGFDYAGIYAFEKWVPIFDHVQAEPGKVNHLSERGNSEVANRFLELCRCQTNGLPSFLGKN